MCEQFLCEGVYLIVISHHQSMFTLVHNKTSALSAASNSVLQMILEAVFTIPLMRVSLIKLR